ncbi:MAG: nitroreductase family protein [Endomicrobiales bacterium]|nr:nitroreductase family protein [Endomicrobiales bacterium]
MHRKFFIVIFTVCSVCLNFVIAENSNTIKLPKPQMSGGRPLMDVLKDRCSIRSFSTKKLPDQILSNLLWAAFGINRPDTKKRTAPSARNWQEVDVYVASEEGLFVYIEDTHELKKISSDDVRGFTGKQSFVKEAPINLIFVADYQKMGGSTDEAKQIYSACDTGFISQNVYLYCASEGLATVVRGLVDKEALSSEMELLPSQRIILAQSVGYPKK